MDPRVARPALLTLVVLCMTGHGLTIAIRGRGGRAFQQQNSEWPVTTCRLAGYSDGCCRISATESCFVQSGSCYCDQTCHFFDDCCDDIHDIGCSLSAPPLPLLSQTEIEGVVTCSSAGLSPGCCVQAGQSDCYVPGGRCYCDRFCHHYNDCCTDVVPSVSCQNTG